MRSDPSEPVLLQRALRDVAEAAHRIETRSFELHLGRVRAKLVPRVDALLEDAVAVLDRVLARYDTPTQSQGPANSGVFHTVFEDIVALATSRPDARQRIADVAFMARWELVRKRGGVSQAEGLPDAWNLIAVCCSARRRVIKAISGVEQVLSEVEEMPSVFEGLYQTELQRALATRAAYARFCTGLHQAVTGQGPGGVLERVRFAGVEIARLMGRSIYEELRVEDRMQLRHLQTRLFEWLREDGSLREGERLLADLSGFSSLLLQVNRRPELIEHDRELLGELLGLLARPANDESAVRGMLTVIRGRDAELDELIEQRAELGAELWCGPIRRVLRSLEQREGGEAR
jgi:hypothetical protein